MCASPALSVADLASLFGSAHTVHPYTGSLTVRNAAAFIAVDVDGRPALLQVGTIPGQYGLSKPFWTEGAGHACLYPFGPGDYGNVRAFAENIERAFLPRPQRDRPAIAAGNRHPEVSLPAVFAAYDSIAGRSGDNLASTVQLSATREMTTDEALAVRDGSDPTAPGHTRVSIQHLYHCGLWAAIRSGYRHGYTAEADHCIVGGSDDAQLARSIEQAKEAVRHAAGYTKFTTDASQVFDVEADLRSPLHWSEAAIDELFERRLDSDVRRWVVPAFVRPFEPRQAPVPVCRARD